MKTSGEQVGDRRDAQRRTGVALLGAIGSGAVIAAAYWPSMHGEFLFDDVLYVVQRPNSHLESLSWDSIRELLSVDILQPHRWLSHLSFGLNYYFFGEVPTSFHAVNVVIHLLTTLGVGLFSGATLRCLGWEADRARRGAWVAAAAFGLHPIQTQAVSYIWQRTASFVTMWVVWGMWCFARSCETRGASRWGFRAGVLCFAILAPLTKQNGILLCPLMWLFHLAILSDGSRRSLQRHLAVAGGVAAIGLGMALLLWVRDYGWEGLFNYSRREFTMAERVMTQPRVIWLYLKLIVLPWPGWLNVDHGVPFSRGLASPWTTLPAMLGVLGLIGLGIWCLRRHRLVGLSLLWFFLCHVPESTVMPLELVFEHRNYMPMVGMALLAAWALDRFKAPKPAWGVLAVVAAGYFGGTYVRNGVYRTEWALFEDAHEKSPHIARPAVFLAEHLKNEGKIDEALAMYEVALKAEPTHAIANHNLGTILSARGQLGPAIERFQAALDRRPDYPNAHSNLASVLFRQRKFDEALAHYQRSVELQPKFLDGHLGMALTLHRLNRLDDALASCEAALAIAPNWATAHFDKGIILGQMGRIDAAIESYRRAIEIQPGYLEAHSNLGQLLAASGRIEEGLTELRTALKIRPDHEISLFGLANTLAAARQYDSAVEAFQRLVRLNPMHAVGHYRLGMLLASQGKTPEAIASLERALRLMPEMEDAYPTLIRFLTEAKRYDEAIEWANRHLAKAPTHRETLLALGEAMLKAGRADSMVQRFEPMFAEPDPDGRMHALVGDGMAELGREREAIDVFRKGQKAAAESPMLALSLARILSMSTDPKLRDGAEAESLAKYVAEASGHRSADVLAVLAAAHAEAGHFEQAVVQAKKAQTLAVESKNQDLAEQIAAQLARYESGQTYLKPAQAN